MKFSAMRNAVRTAFVLAACATLVAACSDSQQNGGGEGGSPPQMEPLSAVGDGEGQLNLVAWAGYAEDGSNDPAVDWVTPFEQQTGCQVNVKVGNTSDEMVQLMRSGQYDGVSASGDATLRLIYAGDVAPVNTDLVPNYATVSDFLKDKPWNSVDGQMYGVPHGWGANLLMYNVNVVRDAPNSWAAVFDDAAKYRGKVTAYDSPSTSPTRRCTCRSQAGTRHRGPVLADTRTTRRRNRTAQDPAREHRRVLVGLHQGGAGLRVGHLGDRHHLAGHRQHHRRGQQGPGQHRAAQGGSTGWSDTWMLSSKAAHPNCMYKWMDWIISPEVNAQVAEYFGEAPAQTKACEHTTQKDFCDIYHATDADFAAKIAYWTTPQTKCVDGSGDGCTAYSEWVDKWQQVKG